MLQMVWKKYQNLIATVIEENEKDFERNQQPLKKLKEVSYHHNFQHCLLRSC